MESGMDSGNGERFAGDRHRSILKLFAIARCARSSPSSSLPLSLWQNKRLPCCWGVSDQHNVYFTIQLKVIQLTNYLRSARALQKEATRRDATLGKRVQHNNSNNNSNSNCNCNSNCSAHIAHVQSLSCCCCRSACGNNSNSCRCSSCRPVSQYLC